MFCLEKKTQNKPQQQKSPLHKIRMSPLNWTSKAMENIYRVAAAATLQSLTTVSVHTEKEFGILCDAATFKCDTK